MAKTKEFTIRTQRAFTLIELLVVISIMGLLSSVVMAQLNQARTRAQSAKAQSDLYDLAIAVANLELDTGLSIGKYVVGACGEDDNENASNLPMRNTYNNWNDGMEFPVTGLFDGVNHDAFAGIVEGVISEYINWKGPYTTTVIDPWGRPYWFDPDYQCFPNGGSVVTKGCELATQAGPSYRVLYSRGPISSGVLNDADSNNIVRILCRNTCQYSDENDTSPIPGTCDS